MQTGDGVCKALVDGAAKASDDDGHYPSWYQQQGPTGLLPKQWEAYMERQGLVGPTNLSADDHKRRDVALALDHHHGHGHEPRLLLSGNVAVHQSRP